ncbi:hypothetical protein GCM10010909_02590 [Acidocella aquatica]|uniref:Uncharacterized protein n=1 Tax=Acidocella aquatica TaxID=1922313 RepID=A0ABQ6A3Y0_9PROT|nr:hypothetical protein GCM10010909_02590 [Acidocella aquatica]
MFQAECAPGGISIIGHGGGDMGNTGRIGVEDEIEAADRGMVEPDLSRAIDPEQRRVAKSGIKRRGGGANQIAGAEQGDG